MPNITCSHKTSILDNSSKKTKIHKNLFIFQILHWTSFLVIPLTFLYDEYIDRPELTEQKKPIEYIVPPPTSGVRTISLPASVFT